MQKSQTSRKPKTASKLSCLQLLDEFRYTCRGCKYNAIHVHIQNT